MLSLRTFQHRMSKLLLAIGENKQDADVSCLEGSRKQTGTWHLTLDHNTKTKAKFNDDRSGVPPKALHRGPHPVTTKAKVLE